jgi:hypothetical protein
MPTAEAAIMWESEIPERVQKWPAQEPKGHLAQSEEVCTPSSGSPRISPELEAEVERAKEILNLRGDWDGEGGSEYSKDTFDRAVAFLTSHSEYLWTLCGLYPAVPHIGPGPEGSIDLHWKRSSWELLVNIPADPDAMASFYGDNFGPQKIKGSIDPKTVNLGIVTWLMT